MLDESDAGGDVRSLSDDGYSDDLQGDVSDDEYDCTPDGDEKFMELYMAQTHLLSCTLQMLWCASDKRLSSAFPDWFRDELSGLVTLNRPPTSVHDIHPSSNVFTHDHPLMRSSAAAGGTDSLHQHFSFTFGLQDFASKHVPRTRAADAADAHASASGGGEPPAPCNSILYLEVKAAREDFCLAAAGVLNVSGKNAASASEANPLHTARSRVASEEWKRSACSAVERFMGRLSRGMRLCVMARNMSVRVSNERKRKASAAT